MTIVKYRGKKKDYSIRTEYNKKEFMMNQLEEFMKYVTGEFTNEQQIKQEEKEGERVHPFARHKNTVINHKIKNLPVDCDGYFVVEESYYETNGKTKPLHHLFFFSSNEKGKVTLTSYQIPAPYTQSNFVFEAIDEPIDYEILETSKHFNTIEYEYEDGTFSGGGASPLSDSTVLIVNETMTKDEIHVSETFEKNGIRTFGYDTPIIYRRIK